MKCGHLPSERRVGTGEENPPPRHCFVIMFLKERNIKSVSILSLEMFSGYSKRLSSLLSCSGHRVFGREDQLLVSVRNG